MRALLVGGIVLLSPLIAQAQYVSCSVWTDKQIYGSGETARISWLSVNARSAVIDGIGPVSPSGFWRTPASKSETIFMRVRGDRGEAQCRTSYTVRAQRPTCHISAVPLAVAQGSFVTLTWKSEHASSVTVSGLGPVQTSGSRVMRADRSNTYTISAVGHGGSCTQSTSVTVQTPASSYGYFPMVANSILNPLFGNMFSKNPSQSHQFDSYYVEIEEPQWRGDNNDYGNTYAEEWIEMPIGDDRQMLEVEIGDPYLDQAFYPHINEEPLPESEQPLLQNSTSELGPLNPPEESIHPYELQEYFQLPCTDVSCPNGGNSDEEFPTQLQLEQGPYPEQPAEEQEITWL